MGTIDIKAVIASYSKDKDDISTWQDFANEVVATGQDEAKPFDKTFRWPESKDCAGTKWSFGITNVSGFAFSESVAIQQFSFIGLRGNVPISTLIVAADSKKAKASVQEANGTENKTSGFVTVLRTLFAS